MKSENGRSMVEMLGVLAIIGVLSVGAIAGYSKAMMKYKLNKHAEAVNMLINNVLQIKGQLPYSAENYYGNLFKKMNLLPDGINYHSNTLLTDKWFKSRITIYRGAGFGGAYFCIPKLSENEEICRNIVLAAKENAADLWQVKLIQYPETSAMIYGTPLWGNNYCSKDSKCLYNMTLNDTEAVCNECDGNNYCCVFVLYNG